MPDILFWPLCVKELNGCAVKELSVVLALAGTYRSMDG